MTQNRRDDRDDRDVVLRKEGIDDADAAEKVDAFEVMRQVESDDDDLEDVAGVTILFVANLVLSFVEKTHLGKC